MQAPPAFQLEGTGDPCFDGLWSVDRGGTPLVNGKRHYRNELGFHCYHVQRKPARWIFHCELQTAGMHEGVAASIKTRGDLPVGTMEWMRPAPDGGWSGVELSLTAAEVDKRRPPFTSQFCQPEHAPGGDDVDSFARYLGLEQNSCSHLLWLAEEALCAPLPEGWTEHVSAQCGAIYFLDTATKTATWSHPLDHAYALTARQLRGCTAHIQRLRATDLPDPGPIKAAVSQYRKARAQHAGSVATVLTSETAEQKKARSKRWKLGGLDSRATLVMESMAERKPATLSTLKAALGEEAAGAAVEEMQAALRPEPEVELDATVLHQIEMDVIRTRGGLLKVVGSGVHNRPSAHHAHGHNFHATVVGPARKQLAAAARLQAVGSFERAHQHADKALQMLRVGFATAHGLPPHEEDEAESAGKRAAAKPERSRPLLWESAHASRTRAQEERKRLAKESPGPTHDEVGAVLAQGHAVLLALKDTAPPARKANKKREGHSRRKPPSDAEQSGVQKSQSLPEISRKKTLSTPAAVAARSGAAQRQQRRLGRLRRERKRRTTMQVRELYASDQTADFERTMLLHGSADEKKQGLSLQWYAHTN